MENNTEQTTRLEEERENQILNKIFQTTGWDIELSAFVIIASQGRYVFGEEEIPEDANVYVCWYDCCKKVYNIAFEGKVITRFVRSTWIDEKGHNTQKITLLTRMLMISKVHEHMGNKP